MIEVNKNTLASALSALGKLIYRTSPMTLFKSIKIESADGKLRLATCGATEEIAFELESGSEDVFSCMVGYDEFIIKKTIFQKKHFLHPLGIMTSHRMIFISSAKENH